MFKHKFLALFECSRPERKNFNLEYLIGKLKLMATLLEQLTAEELDSEAILESSKAINLALDNIAALVTDLRLSANDATAVKEIADRMQANLSAAKTNLGESSDDVKAILD